MILFCDWLPQQCDCIPECWLSIPAPHLPHQKTASSSSTQANITLPDAANDTAGLGARKLLAGGPCFFLEKKLLESEAPAQEPFALP